MSGPGLRPGPDPGEAPPKIWGDLTPVTTSITRIVLCMVGSTAAPQMIRAVGLTVFCTTSAASVSYTHLTLPTKA